MSSPDPKAQDHECHACEKLMAAASEMHESIGELRALMINKSLGVQFGGSEAAMRAIKEVFSKMEHAWRRAGAAIGVET